MSLPCEVDETHQHTRSAAGYSDPMCAIDHPEQPPSPETPPTPVTIEEVCRAASRLHNVANHTPVLTSRTLDRRLGAHALLKCENLQRIGAFKFRGAYNALSAHKERHTDRQPPGVLTYSSGNHAQAIALAGRILDIPTVIVMPADAPEIKRRATAGYLSDLPGAEIVLYDRSNQLREEVGARLARERTLNVIPPYDHPDVIAGQGTAALELFQNLPEDTHVDTLFVCCGGGGLLSGSAIATKSLSPDTRVIGVEPQLADDATRSFHTRTLHAVHNPPTIADGARTPSLGRWTFPLVLQLVDDMITVSEQEIAAAMAFCLSRMKLLVEPSGALALAGAFRQARAGKLDAKTVAIIISGGNVDLAELPRLLALAEDPDA